MQSPPTLPPPPKKNKLECAPVPHTLYRTAYSLLGSSVNHDPVEMIYNQTSSNS